MYPQKLKPLDQDPFLSDIAKLSKLAPKRLAHINESVVAPKVGTPAKEFQRRILSLEKEVEKLSGLVAKFSKLAEKAVVMSQQALYRKPSSK